MKDAAKHSNELSLGTVSDYNFSALTTYRFEYMYTGQLKVTCQELSDVYRSARKLGMKGAMQECVESGLDIRTMRDDIVLVSKFLMVLKRSRFNRFSGGSAKLCQVIYSQFGLAIHKNDHQARRRFVEWAQNEIAVVPDFHKRILFSDEAHFWLNGYVNKPNCRIWSEANPQVYVETPLHPETLTVWCALWAGGILFQKR
ncbi:hypothetical protein TNCV_2434751 [Trichonephila clavipes]|nr:hypothetical protein TNCV_2434751 [Trichonephila clavipes]